MGADEVLTMEEICDLLQVHKSTVYKLVRRGSIPGFRVGVDWRFRKDVIERWMTEQTIYAQGVRKVIEKGANGEARHRRRGPYAGNLDLNSKAAGLFGRELLAILKRSSLQGDEPAREGRLANLSADG